MSRKKRRRAQPTAGGSAEARPPTQAADAGDEGAPRDWGSLALLALGGVWIVHALLLAQVFNPSPHSGGDNAGYLTLAFSLLDRGAYLDLYDPAAAPHTKYPPGYPLLLAAGMAAGGRTWAFFKVLSGLAIWASVILATLWARRRYGWGVALAGGLMLAFSNALLYASQWILSDPLFLALTMGTLVALQRKGRPWVVAGCVGVIAAFFTRSAGLPLVLAVGSWFMIRRRAPAALGFGLALAVPAILWWMRGQQHGGDGYTGEFWMVNPYQPDLGTVGVLGLVGRVGENLVQYVLTHIPVGLVGPVAWAPVLGVALLALGVWGWVRRLRDAEVAELFVPLYSGLILLWPPVWSGDRFALPLIALLVFYAADAAGSVLERLPARPRPWVAALAVAMLVVPAALHARSEARTSALCRDRTQDGAFECYAGRMQEYVAAAEWSGANLPEGSVVMTRKPRLFYAVSGVPARIFPFSSDPDALEQAADSAGSRYAIIDYLDNITAFYLIPALEQRPGLFCTLGSFGGDARGIRTELLGLQSTDGPGAEPTEREGGAMSLALDRCDDSYVRPGAAQEVYSPSASGRIPLLEALDRSDS